MTRDVALLAAHLLALAGAAFALTVLAGNPDVTAQLPAIEALRAFASDGAAGLSVVLGAAAMLAFGARSIGMRRTAIFFATSTAVSLGAELIGTGTGGPFGAYSFTDHLGAKLFDLVPWTVPLSWFYLGFTSFLLARLVLGRFEPRPAGWATVLLGAWFLLAFDIVSDPAMASPALAVPFRIWHASGSVLGLPLLHLAGSAACAILFMGLSVVSWGGDVETSAVDRRFVFAMYVANVLAAVVVCASVGLWQPILVAAFAGLVPAALVGVERVDEVAEKKVAA